MAYNKERVKRMLAKYAKYIGGVDESGNKHFEGLEGVALEAHQRKHLFAVKNKDLEDTAWSFAHGNTITEFIRQDSYDIDYIGLASNAITSKKYQKYAMLQLQDLLDAKRRSDEKAGIVRLEGEYEDMLSEWKTTAEERFAQYA